MKFIVNAIVIAALLCNIPAAAAAEDYRLHAQDIISVSVWGIDDLQLKDLIIRDDGRFGYPLIGDVAAAGLTPRELAGSMEQSLALYYYNPRVTVNVQKFHTTRVYVLGEVNRPGLYEIERQHRVLDAIGLAGGYTPDAAKKRIMIISQAKPRQPVETNLLKLLREGDTSQNLQLADGDVVYLTSNHRLDFNRDIFPIISGLYYIKNWNDD